MKKLLFFLTVLSLAFSCGKDNWNTNTNNNVAINDTLNSWLKITTISVDNEDIWFTSTNNGIIATQTGGIFTTSDGGTTWNSIPNTGNTTPYNLQFVDSLNGFAQGVGISATTDGGKTWMTRGPNIGANYFQFINRTTGFYFNSGTGLFATHDGGDTWKMDFAVPAGNIAQNTKFPFYFLDSLKGFSMMSGNCYKTSDGGATWTIESNVTTKNFTGFYKIQFLDSLNGFSGISGELIKTTDGGKNWTSCLPVITSTENFIVPQFFDTNNGYCMTRTGIFKTTDGGQNWTTSCRVSDGSLFGIHFLDMNTGWSCSTKGYILKLKL